MITTNFIINKILLPALTITLFTLMAVNLVSAHTSGFSVEKEVGDFIVDLGYSNEILIENTQLRFDFILVDNKYKTPQNFSEVWVRIENDERLLFASGLGRARFGDTGMAYSFPEAGTYKISTRFSNATSTLAEAEFEFVVQRQSRSLSQQTWFWPVMYTSTVWFIASSIILVLSNFFLRKNVASQTPKTKFNHQNRNRIIKICLNILLFLILVGSGYLLTLLVTEFLEK